MTKFDKLLIMLGVFTFVLLWMLYFVKDAAAAIFIALLITILVSSVGMHLLNRKEDKSKISVAEMENLLALYGSEYQIDLLMKATPQYFQPSVIENGITLTLNCKKVAAFTNYKYSLSSPEDIAKFYRLAKKYEVSKAYILSRPSPRNVLVLAAGLDIDFVFVTSRQWHNYLYKQNMLMDNIKPMKIKRPRRKLSEVFSEIFQKKRAKYFFFCALTFAIFCVISPYKIYYLVMSSIVISMGIACLLRKA